MPIGGDPGISDGWPRHGAPPTNGPVRNDAPATGNGSNRSANSATAVSTTPQRHREGRMWPDVRNASGFVGLALGIR